MKYKINKVNALIIYNDFDNLIFIISKENQWVNWEYDHNGNTIY